MKIDQKNLSIETLAIHAGQTPDPSTGAIMTPIYQTSTYVQPALGKHFGYEYSRTKNPTRSAYEACVAALEIGEDGVGFGAAFGSGCAATTTLIHLLDPSDHVIASDDLYGGTFRLFDKVFARNKPKGHQFSFVDLTNFETFRNSFRPETKMVWIETPTNPMLKIIDLEKIISYAKEKNALVVVDNTFMSPYFQKPFRFGADVVLHSATKYLNGHSDIVGGITVTKNKELADRIYFLQNSIGAIAGPMDSWLAMRGIKTLHIRMDRHAENAQYLAEKLAAHPAVEKVIYPGLETHAQYALAKKQMSGPGGMISFTVKGDIEKAKAVVENTKIFALAESLGGVESLIEHPAIMTHASVPPENRKALGISDTLVRISVGIESKEDLWDDLKIALN
ncbi:MAG: PLP-dependent aspartate aminotransferase family protein [Oligoflexia bacterium]|nr:PLP-dependent aspartate aminotransferase family protein [Oligoflexia bacterium]